MIQKRVFTRQLNGLAALLLVAGVLAQMLLPGKAFAVAQQITTRSLTLEAGTSDVNSDGIPDGGSMPGATVKHLFNFTLHNTTQLGSISFQYCTTADAVSGGIGCDAPAGLDVTGVGIANETGGITGFTATHSTACDNSCATPNVITIALSSATGVTDPTLIAEEFSGIVNPTTANQTFYARIFTYTSTSGGTLDPASANDYGVVAASTANPIVLTGQMPESLIFCTGHTVDINASGVPDCTTATSGNVSFNQLFDPNSTSWAYSQMAAATNATSGYVITVNGPTLTSGSNTITAIGSTADISRPDTRQFGLNLVDDSTDSTIGTASDNPITYYSGDGQLTGGALNPVSDNINYAGQAATGFDGTGGTDQTYSFATGTNNIVAKSNSTGTNGPSDTQRYTATYIVNVSGNLPAGSYSTTLTYICTPTF